MIQNAFKNVSFILYDDTALLDELCVTNRRVNDELMRPVTDEYPTEACNHKTLAYTKHSN